MLQMSKYAEKGQKSLRQSIKDGITNSKGRDAPTFQLFDNRSDTIAQRTHQSTSVRPSVAHQKPVQLMRRAFGLVPKVRNRALVVYQQPQNAVVVHQPPQNAVAVHQPPQNAVVVHQPPQNQVVPVQPPQNVVVADQDEETEEDPIQDEQNVIDQPLPDIQNQAQQEANERFKVHGHGASGIKGLKKWERWFLTSFEGRPFDEGQEADLHRGPDIVEDDASSEEKK